MRFHPVNPEFRG